MVFPLDGVSHMVNKELAHFQYTINVVPTVFTALGHADDDAVQSFQYVDHARTRRRWRGVGDVRTPQLSSYDHSLVKVGFDILLAH
jgi:hypothetical protein